MYQNEKPASGAGVMTWVDKHVVTPYGREFFCTACSTMYYRQEQHPLPNYCPLCGRKATNGEL